MPKFEEVTSDVVKMMDEIIKNDFPTIVNARIKPLFTLTKKSSKGQLIVGQMVKATPILNYLTSSNNSGDDGYNYIMFLDEKVFQALDIQDKRRIIRHELNHINIDLDAKDPYKICNHDLEDFYKEMEYNKDDMRWKERVAAIAESIYAKEGDE